MRFSINNIKRKIPFFNSPRYGSISYRFKKAKKNIAIINHYNFYNSVYEYRILSLEIKDERGRPTRKEHPFNLVQYKLYVLNIGIIWSEWIEEKHNV